LTAGSNLLQRPTYLDEKQRLFFIFFFVKEKEKGFITGTNFKNILFGSLALLSKLRQVTVVTLLGYIMDTLFVAKLFWIRRV
jgi:hypothetical protein